VGPLKFSIYHHVYFIKLKFLYCITDSIVGDKSQTQLLLSSF